MKSTSIKVSVCMATFNGEPYVIEQIESILKQLSKHDELIISDDGSTDRTLSLINSLSDSRIKLYLSGNQGVIGNFENAIKQASGDIIILSDQDDVWLPGRLDIALEKLKFYDLVVVGYQVVDAKLDQLNCILPNAELSVYKTLFKNGYLGCSMAFRTSIIPTVLPFPKNIGMHDWWIALICLLKYRVYIERDKYFLYRRHGTNASATGGRSKLSTMKKLKMRFFMLLALVERCNELTK